MKNGNNNDNEINVAGNQVKDAEIVKRTIKDSVFTNLFRDRRYLIQLYKTLHPEDTEVTEDELSDITIHNILTDGIYNDLGFMRGDRLLILVEAQSTWTTNIIIRSLMYLMTTYQDYFKRTEQNIYNSAKVTFPKAELYVIFTGERQEHPEYMSLSKEFFDGQECFLDVRVKVLYGSGEDDIVSQYVTFTKIYDEQRKLYGRTLKAITETIRICKDKNVLKKYLEECEKEVVNIMLAMCDEKQIMLDYIEYERRKAAKEAAREAAKEAAKEVAKETAIQMLKAGKLSLEEIVQYVPSLSIEDVERIRKELL